ncbi:probable aspartic proteinase GIP2 [Mercurialis annua]|uniref:probable aspartic proteinase GIP2 n=1 Tax=Mercurialis annua TaxID=3986 RepID=UPI0024AD627C|nr:probable aspartic proteinase GIP2 [Mercurialis annua]
MASLTPFLIFTLFISLSALSNAQTTSKPKALLLPITKDASTLQYLTTLKLGTPLVDKTFAIDLGGKHLWMVCESGYNSSTYRPGHCGSAACSVTKPTFPCLSLCHRPSNPPPSPGCNNNSCRVLAENPFFGGALVIEVALDTISLRSTDGSKSGPAVSVPNFIFACAENQDLNDIATGANGIIGLGTNRVGFPSQLSALFGGSFRRKLAVCLPSTSKSNGVMFFGDSPHNFYPGYNTSKVIDVSSRFMFTKLYTNFQRTASPRVQGEQLLEYFVKITSILVNNNPIPLNTSLLEFRRTGIGGTKITTVSPYTILESSIYDSLVKAFDKEILKTSKVKKVEAVAPFTDCYTKGNLGMSILGLGVPDISIVFENNKDAIWQIYGANSMVEMSNDVACLGFLRVVSDTGTGSSIEIGGLQLQDNLVQFDLAASRMAFTNTLLLEEVECSNFKF